MALDVQISFSWTNYCRLCLLDNGIMLPLFDDEGQSRQLGHKIETCFHLVTYDGDPLPKRICHKCLYKINQMYEFRVMALESFEKLKGHLLPLKHVPEVRQYLERADSFQRGIDFNDMSPDQCSTPSTASGRSDNLRADRAKIRIKAEKDLMGDTINSPWLSAPSPPHPRDLDEDLPRPNNPSMTLTSSEFNFQAQDSNETSVIHDNCAVLPDSLKRKRCLTAATSDASENSMFPLSKKVKSKKQLPGPASQKNRIQSSQWKCVFCQLSFRSRSILRSHLDKCLKCPMCREEFSCVADKAIHEAKCHISVVIDCKKEHMRKRCSRCPARFASSVMLATHSKYDHQTSQNMKPKEDIKLETCDDSSLSDEDYPLSLLKESSKPSGSNTSTSRKCLMCLKTFSSSLSFDSHGCFPNTSNVFSCGICNESFPGAQVLLEHEKMIHGRYKCPVCHIRFESHKSCNAHRKAHKKQTNSKTPVEAEGPILKAVLASEKKKILSCHTCFEEFEEEDPFILHLYKHAIEQSDDEKVPKKKSRKGQESGRKITPNSNREENDELSDQYSVKCERCHFVCRSKEYYKVHLATHMSKSKSSFPCSGCNQDFRNVEALNRHTCCGKLPEKKQTCCLDCGQALVQGEDHVCDNKCPQCDKVFKSARGQRLHFLHKHQRADGDVEATLCNGDPQVFSSDENNIDHEEDQSENGEEYGGKKKSPINEEDVHEMSKTSDFEINHLRGESPIKERLPPEGASNEDPALFQVESANKGNGFHSTTEDSAQLNSEPNPCALPTTLTEEIAPSIACNSLNDNVKVQERVLHLFSESSSKKHDNDIVASREKNVQQTHNSSTLQC